MSKYKGTALKFLYIFTILMMFAEPRVNKTGFQPVSRTVGIGSGISYRGKRRQVCKKKKECFQKF